MTTRLLVAILALSVSTIGFSRSIEDHQLTRPDGSKIHYYLVHPDNAASPPHAMLVLLHGSDCNSVINNPRVHEYFELAPAAVIVLIEKYGVDRTKGYEPPGEEATCPQEYLENNTISQRVMDTLQVIAELQRSAKWWGGETVLWGGSEGGMVASYVALLSPSTTALVASSFGGGQPVSEIVKMSIAGSESFPSEEAKSAALRNVEKQFAVIRQEPVPTRTMGGAGNTYKWWADAMDLDGRIILRQLEIPILVVQGQLDEEAPVEAARELARSLDGKEFTYKEFSGLDHLYQDPRGESHRERVIGYQRRWMNALLDVD